ncbi:tRNA lysidine(34) synthetase TilS [Gorillibacterium timonense]|uniref:tRNA lysidine(34) synthetase TilS n=1 Tax=Gorillibacterium timonense TaxID=1689269 RepID=UPI00071E4EA1|nr:tRNA lysidine(34) synthetase TilS [Gorillibacterium timonense]
MLYRQVEEQIREEGLLAPGDSVVVAVSGGPDSMALLHLLSRFAPGLQLKLTVAHVNHGFRGEESDEEERMVEAYTRKLGLPFRVAHLDMPAYIRDTGMNGQAASREQRRAFLIEAAAGCGAAKVALAHHAGDQAETVLMRFLRGAGPTGLSGIAAERTFANVELIRPLLRINKEALVGYCEAEGIPYRIDSSNGKRTYTRNRIRLDVMPLLREYNPRLEETLGRLADVMQAENAYLTEAAAAAFSSLVRPLDGGFAFSRKAFAGLHLALQRRLIKLLLDYLATGTDQQDDFGYSLTEIVRSAVLREGPPNFTLDLAGNLQFCREYDLVKIASPDKPLPFLHYIAEKDAGSLSLPLEGLDRALGGFTATERSDIPDEGRNGRDYAVFDWETLCFPLTVRSRREGDRMNVMGLKGVKKVKDIFIDEKIPASKREIWPIVADGNGRILWLPGIRQAAHSVVTEKTGIFFCMTFTGPQL